MNSSKISLYKSIARQLPQNWKIVSVGKVIVESQYGTNSPSIENGNTSVIGMKDIQNGKVITTNLVQTNLNKDEKKNFDLSIEAVQNLMTKAKEIDPELKNKN